MSIGCIEYCVKQRIIGYLRGTHPININDILILKPFRKRMDSTRLHGRPRATFVSLSCARPRRFSARILSSLLVVRSVQLPF